MGQQVFAQAPIKVACVGNSITQGPGRENPDSYPLQMQKKLGKNYEVIIVNEMVPLIRQAAEKTGATLVDLHEPMEKYGKLFADGVHPNKKGNKIMAKLVSKKIR